MKYQEMFDFLKKLNKLHLQLQTLHNFLKMLRI